MTSPAQPQMPPPARTTQMPVLYSALVVIATVTTVSMLGGAGLSGVFAGHGFAIPGPLVPTVTAWFTHPGDPAAAWSTDPRPGPAWLVYTIAALIAAGLIWAWWTAAVWWGVRQDRKRLPGNGLAATRQVSGVLGERGAKETALRTRASLAGKKAKHIAANELVVPIGPNVVDGQMIAVQPKDAIVVVGGSGAGKSWRVAVKLILFAPGFVLVTTTKGDLLVATYLPRLAKGRVAVFDPEGISGWPDQVKWSVIAGCEDPSTAKRRAAALVAARPLKGAENSQFFAGRAAVVLRCYLYAAAVGAKRISDIRRWAGTPRAHEVREILDAHLPDWSNDFVKATSSGDPKTDGNVMSTVADILEPLSSPQLMAAVDVSAAESLDLGEFIDGSNTLYLISEGESDSIAPFVAAMANEVHFLARRMSQLKPGRRLDPPMRMVLDEMCNVAPIPNMPGKMSDSGGRGITLWAFVHNMDQLRNRFGQHQAQQLIDSASGRLILSGLLSHDVLEDTSRLLGTMETWQAQPGPGGQWQHRPHEQRVMRPEEIRTMPENEGLLVYRNQPGVKVRLLAYFEGDVEQAELVEPSMAYGEECIAQQQLLPIAVSVSKPGAMKRLGPGRADVKPTGVEFPFLESTR